MSNDTKPGPGTTVYMASCLPTYSADRVGLWFHTGKVSPCGEWVEVGEARYPLTAWWHTRRVDASASAADAIEATGRAYIAQAEELRRRAAE